jgi:hypothetical protein
MSLASYVYRIEKDGKDVICEIYDDEINDSYYKKLYDTYKDLFVESEEILYDVENILNGIKEKYTLEMSDSEVSLDGYRVWVKELEGPIITSLEDIPTVVEKCYTLRATVVNGITEPDIYKSYVYANSHTYIVGKEEWDTVLNLFPRKHHLHNIKYEDNLVIFNSY